MAKLQPISNITFSQNLLQPWGKTWLDTVSSTVGKAKNANCFDRKQAMDFGKALDPIVGDAIAQMLGGIPVKVIGDDAFNYARTIKSKCLITACCRLC